MVQHFEGIIAQLLEAGLSIVWDGRVALLPGRPVHVYDTYVAGAGRLHAAMFGTQQTPAAHGAQTAGGF